MSQLASSFTLAFALCSTLAEAQPDTFSRDLLLVDPTVARRATRSYGDVNFDVLRIASQPKSSLFRDALRHEAGLKLGVTPPLDVAAFDASHLGWRGFRSVRFESENWPYDSPFKRPASFHILRPNWNLPSYSLYANFPALQAPFVLRHPAK